MTRRYMCIRVPGTKNGYLDEPDTTREQIIKSFRAQADYYRQRVLEIDACCDSEFEIDLVLGASTNNIIKKI